MSALISKAKLCVSVDWPVALHPRHPLYKATDALVIKDPKILHQIGNPTYRLPHFSEQESRNIAETVNSRRLLTYHAQGVIEESFMEQFATPGEDGKTTLELLQEKGIPYISFHIGTCNTRIRKDGHAWIGEEDTNLARGVDFKTFLRKFMPLFEDRLRTIRNMYHGTLGFENMSYHPTRRIGEYVCEPRLINEVFSSFSDLYNLYFLLDIAHAQVAAYWQEINAAQYIASLPLHKVIEVHLCRPTLATIPGFEGTHLLDIHDLPGDREYELLESTLLKGARPEFLTIEYSKDAQKLLEAYKRLREFISFRPPHATT